MPLLDHFTSPVLDRQRWNSFHMMWPAMIVRHLFDILPDGYVAAPGAHFGSTFEIDVATFDTTSRPKSSKEYSSDEGVVATAIMPPPTLTLEADLSDQDEFEVRIYDEKRGHQLVAAIEIVSPSNKDRPENRQAFVAKAAALLRRDVCVAIVDLVTVRKSNLCVELLEQFDRRDPQIGGAPRSLYCVTLRKGKRAGARSLLDLWYYPMQVGDVLPTLPIWLRHDEPVLLPLEEVYEETCRVLRMR